MAKKGQIQKRYSTEFKVGVIIDMREHRLSYHETVRKYELGNDKQGGARLMLQRWERILKKRNRRLDERETRQEPYQRKVWTPTKT